MEETKKNAGVQRAQRGAMQVDFGTEGGKSICSPTACSEAEGRWVGGGEMEGLLQVWTGCTWITLLSVFSPISHLGGNSCNRRIGTATSRAFLKFQFYHRAVALGQDFRVFSTGGRAEAGAEASVSPGARARGPHAHTLPRQRLSSSQQSQLGVQLVVSVHAVAAWRGI